MKKSTSLQRNFYPGSSRGPRSARTLALQMAVEYERQLEVAQRLRDLRGPKPQEQIADEVGVTLRAYSAWEAGGGIAYKNLQKLAEVHGVTTNWLLYGDERPEGARSQLDRIEAKLDELLSRLPEPVAEIQRLQAEEIRRAPAPGAGTPASRRTPRRSGKAH